MFIIQRCRATFRGGMLPAVALLILPVPAFNQSGAECTFQAKPDEFLLAQSRVRTRVHQTALKLSRAAETVATLDPASIKRRNVIDDEIFGKMKEQNVRSAPLSSDEEFLRRITLDLTGRIPSPDDVRAFLASDDPQKRPALIDRLLHSPEFIDKWTWWLADLLQVNATASNVNLNINGRNAFYLWIQTRVRENSSLKDIAYQAVTGSGNSYLMEEGASNFVVKSTTPGGPINDQWDAMLSKTASAFLGMGYYDCLLCHNGRGHLDSLSLWGGQTTRMQAEAMAAFFSRQNIANHPSANDPSSFFSGARLVSDKATGDYPLNTTNGNRPPRCAPSGQVVNNRCTATMNLSPEYHFTGATPSGGRSWRETFADNMTDDPMFARNIANRLWKEMFNLGLVDPVDTMDPMRLDPQKPPPTPWTLQATHPVLLEKLAAQFRDGSWDLRSFLSLIANSNAYQLSSRYGDDWSIEYVPLFARHYPRRLEGEEVHDAIVQATEITPSYTVQNFYPPAVNWAMQLPDPAEPRSNGDVANFLNAFLRGNRDNSARNQSGSILQQLSLMNHNVVVTRNKVAASPALKAIANMTANDKAVEELYLTFLGRMPSSMERASATATLTQAANQNARNAAVEDLAWVLLNKVEFIFSY